MEHSPRWAHSADAGSSHRAAKAAGRKGHPGVERPAKLTQAGGGEAAGAQRGAPGRPPSEALWPPCDACLSAGAALPAAASPAQLHLRLSLSPALPDCRGGALCPQTPPRPASAQRPPLRPVGQALPCGAGGRRGGGPLGCAPPLPRPRRSAAPGHPTRPPAPGGMPSAGRMTRRHASEARSNGKGTSVYFHHRT